MRYKFGDLIEEVTERNSNLKYGLDDTIGVTIEKGLIPTVANLSQTALDKFYIVRRNTFIYNPRTHGVRIGMGFNKTDKVYITSWNNVAFKVKKTAESIVNPNYLWLYFCRSEWDRETNYYALGSSTIVFLWSIFLDIEIDLPEKSIQDSIVDKYRILQDRIELKKKINDNLAGQINCFYNTIIADVEKTVPLSTICEYSTQKAMFSSIETGCYISTENMLPDKQGISSYGSTSDTEKVVVFYPGDILVSNIRPYFKKMWYATTKGGCNTDVLCFHAKGEYDSLLLKSVIYQDAFFDYVMSGAKGTKMPRGDKHHIMQYPIPHLTSDKLMHFYNLAKNIELMQSQNRIEIESLSAASSLLLTTLSR